MMQHNYECGNQPAHSRQDVMLAANVSANHRYLQGRHLYQTSYTLYTYETPFTSGGGNNGGGDLQANS